MIATNFLSEMPENMSINLSLKFDYENLDSEIKMVVKQRTNEIKCLMRHTTQEIIEIGHKLIDVKAKLGHGNFRNWLKAEFDWSVQTANRFMQVAENFKCPNLIHLDIAISALYLLAAPSTPEDAREEALKRANLGENITYTKAKVIVSKYKESNKTKAKTNATLDTYAGIVECDFSKSTKQGRNETASVTNTLVPFIEKEVKNEKYLLSLQNFLSFSEPQEQELIINRNTNIEQIEDNITEQVSGVNQNLIIQKTLDPITNEIENRIKQLTPEDLALVITNSAKSGLSKHHLEAIITAAQKALSSLTIGSG